MPIEPPPPPGPASRGLSFGRFSSVSRHAKDTVKRLRAYLKDRRPLDVESLSADVQLLSAAEWCEALPEERQRNNGKVLYFERSTLEQFSDMREDPFEIVYSRELLSRLEALLPPEQAPYLDAFLIGEKPKDVARRLGISPKAASARMRRFKAKLAELYAALRTD